MTQKKRKPRLKTKSTPTNTVVEEKKVVETPVVKTPVEETQVVEKPNEKKREPNPFLIDGKKQYWHNKINCSGRVIFGLVYDTDVDEFFSMVKDVDYSTWMSKTDRIQDRLDLIKEKIKRKSGLK